jgi:hypothetical protein
MWSPRTKLLMCDLLKQWTRFGFMSWEVGYSSRHVKKLKYNNFIKIVVFT